MKLIALYSPGPQMGKGSFSAELQIINTQPSTVVSFAEAMRDLVVPLVADFFPGGEFEVEEWLMDSRKDTALIPGLGVTLRHMLQTIGTKWGRQCIHPDIWVKKAKQQLRYVQGTALVIVDDMRFENEYHMLRKEGAVLVRIERKDVPATNYHESNGRLEDMEFDYRVSNDGDLEELRMKAMLVAKSEGII